MVQFNKLIQAQFDKMSKSGKLFRVELTGRDVWDIYINSFSNENNPTFRDPESSSKNCNHCKNFIRRYGNIVSINDKYEIVTIFDVKADEEYAATAKALTKAIKASKVMEVFYETFNELNSLPYEKCTKNNKVFQLGVPKNTKQYTKEEAEKFGVVKSGEIRTFNHMSLSLDKAFVDLSGKSVEAIMAEYRDAHHVFQRTMDSIPLDTLELVRDLIRQGSLLDGTSHLFKVEQMIPLKKEYDELSAKQRNNWYWVKSYGFNLAKFGNELIGTLCYELAEGKELNDACKAWNIRVDPVNYMKASAPITQKQINEARKFIEENGYTEAFDRRHATIDDIRVSEILHANAGDGKIKKVSMFDEVKPTSTRHKRSEYDGLEEVTIDKFMSDILPTCKSIEALLTSQHEGNLVSLTTTNDTEAKHIFKWDNDYSWTFNGNLAGKSQIKEAVKSKGGKVDGVLRFSIIWNEDGKDVLDFDAHATEPNGTEIYYASYKAHKTAMSGMLDVDMIRPQSLGVENIVWSDIKKMKDGVYTFWIRNFDGGRNKGFKAEIEFNGETYTYEHSSPVGNTGKGRDIHVAEVTLKDGRFSIKHLIPESAVSSKEVYGLETNKFHKVNLVCLSPNHWGDSNVGNKHYMFMLDGCKAPTAIRSFHSENLIPELAKHRKVLEVLGNTTMVEPTEKQLSGLGFNATVRDELIVKLQGTHKRVLKITFGS